MKKVGGQSWRDRGTIDPVGHHTCPYKNKTAIDLLHKAPPYISHPTNTNTKFTATDAIPRLGTLLDIVYSAQSEAV